MPRSHRLVQTHPLGSTILLLLTAALCLAVSTPAQAQISRISLVDGLTEADHPNQQANDHSTTSLYGLSSSADGKVIAFTSFASNLVPNDNNGFSDVYVRNTDTNETELISVSMTGAAGNNISYHPAISRGGRWVAFASGASDLVPGDNNGVVDVFLRDRLNSTTVRLSTEPDGTEPNVWSSFPSIATSADETIVYLSFTSRAKNLTGNNDGGLPNIYHCTYDSLTDTKTIVNCCVGSAGQYGDEASALSAISGDGRFVVYTTQIWNIIPPSKEKPVPPILQILVYDHAVGYSQFRLVVTPDDGAFPAISGDGRFFSYIKDGQVYLYDVLKRADETVSIAQDGAEGDGTSGEASISYDGRFVAFMSSSANLVSGDTNGAEDVFVRDRAIRKTIRVSLTDQGREADLDSRAPSISQDGERIAFSSSATNILDTDTNNREDVYLSLWRNPFQTPGSQPNMMIKNADDTWYVGFLDYNDTAANQSTTQVATRAAPVQYHLKVRNDGSAPDTFIVTGSGPTSGWQVHYFDALTDGNDVTSQVIGPGFSVGPMAPGALAEMRLEVSLEPGVQPTLPHEALVTVTSASDAANIDAVKAITTQTTLASQPDLLVRTEKDTWYVGNDIINDTADNQVSTQTADPGQAAVFHIKVQNDGTIADSFSVSGDPGGNGWTVRYYDALTGGTDITTQINAYGWSTATLPPGASEELRAEVAVDEGVQVTAAHEIMVRVQSNTDATRSDAVKAVTNPPVPRQFTKNFTAGTWLVGIPVSPVNPAADQVFGTTSVAGWNATSQAYVYHATQALDVQSGQGYWVKFPTAKQLVVAGFAPTMPLEVDVLSDWNLLGNPSPVSLPWTNISATGSIQDFGWVQKDDGTGYELVTNLSLSNALQDVPGWKGMWLRANENCTVQLGSATTAAVNPDAVKWAVQLIARAGGAVDEANYVGAAETALTGSNPPSAAGSHVDLYAVSHSGDRNAVSLAAAGQATTWDLVAETDLPNTAVEVSFPDLSDVPAGLALTLTDLDTGKRLNMRTASSYAFVSGAEGGKRRLRVEAQERSGGALITTASAASSAGGAQIVYTLSAPADVRAQVMNIAGRTVATVDCGYQTEGTHTAAWNGRGGTGAAVPSGQYLIRITATGDDGTVSGRVCPARVR